MFRPALPGPRFPQTRFPQTRFPEIETPASQAASKGKKMKQADRRPSADGSFNVAALRGVVSSEVRVSELPDGGVVHNFEMRTGEGDQRHVVPVAWHDPVRPPRLQSGDAVVVVGAVRRRWFRAGGSSQSRTELLADVVTRADSSRASTALVGVASLTAGAAGRA
ncbi:MAG: hypothetical protein RIB98_00905 [Acidimicrobiales bacterium]